MSYLILGAFVAVEPLLRRGDAARSRQPQTSDQGSTRVISIAFNVAGWGTTLLGRARWGRTRQQRLVAWMGVSAMIAGLTLHIWAMRTLGRSYTRTLRLQEGQRIVATGPYRWVRHPGYLGTILMWIGFGLASGSWPAVIFDGSVISAAYLYRIRKEEAMLLDGFSDEFRDYQEATSRLIPGIF